MNVTLFAKTPEFVRLLSSLEVRQGAQRLPLSLLSVPRRGRWPQSNRLGSDRQADDAVHSKSCSYRCAYSNHGEGFTNGLSHD